MIFQWWWSGRPIHKRGKRKELNRSFIYFPTFIYCLLSSHHYCYHYHTSHSCVCVCEKRINTVYFFTTNVNWFHRYLLCTCRDFGPCMREPLRVQPDTLHLILSRETLAPFHRLTAHWITLLGWCLCVRARNGNNATAWRKKNIKIKRKYVSCWLHKYVSAAFSSRNIAR